MTKNQGINWRNMFHKTYKKRKYDDAELVYFLPLRSSTSSTTSKNAELEKVTLCRDSKKQFDLMSDKNRKFD